MLEVTPIQQAGAHPIQLQDDFKDDVLEFSIVFAAAGVPMVVFQRGMAFTEKILWILATYLVFGVLVLGGKSLFRALRSRLRKPLP